jgi:hypothetical protein
MPIAKPLRMTDPVEVHSSSLARLSYDRQQAILQVEFREGTAYQYAGVPLMTYLFDPVASRLHGRLLQSTHSRPISLHGAWRCDADYDLSARYALA